MIFKLVFSKIAILDLEKIVRYYSGIMGLAMQLGDFPKSGRIIPECQEDFSDKYREIIFKNYRIMYRINEKDITVLRIMDSRRLLDINFLE